MVHLHEVRDMDTHYVIDPITMAITNANEAKNKLMLGDHDSEIYTFAIPRMIEGHDMSLCNLVEVHFINLSASKVDKSEGVYQVLDMAVDEDSSETLVFSWKVSGKATQYAGSLNYRIKFACIDENGNYTYKKWTDVYKGITVSDGFDNGESLVEENTDIIAQWAARLDALEQDYLLKGLTEGSYSCGTDNYAGLLGYFFSKIDLANKKVVLSTTQQVPVIGTYNESQDKDASISTGYAVGEKFSIVNGSHYDLCGTISAIDANVITYTTDGLGFTAISSVSEPDYDDYTFAVPTQPNIGVAVVAKNAFAFGTGNKATGIGSFVEGRDNLGVGNYSHVEGRSNVAAYASHAEGQNTQALGMRSHTEGGSTKTTANYAHAEGVSTTASGYASHAQGEGTVAQGRDSHAEGRDVQAVGNYAHAEGYKTLAEGYGSHAEGETTKATGIRSHAEGHNTSATDNAAHAEGHDTVASAYIAHAEGRGSVASGIASHAEGHGTLASGYASHAGGRDTKATADYAHVEGYSNTASGMASHAEGFNCTASGPYSHAEGSSCLAYGYGGHAHGVRSYSHGAAQSVFGMHNRVDEVPEGVDETTVDGRTKYVIIVGNGTSSSYADRSNAATIDWDGNAWFAGGIILTSPNGTRYRITVTDKGELAVAPTTL